MPTKVNVPPHISLGSVFASRPVSYKNYGVYPLAELEVTHADPRGWSFEVRERSAGVYEVTGTHVSGASVGAVRSDPEDLVVRVRHDARELLSS